AQQRRQFSIRNGGRLIRLMVRRNLLDVHWWRQLVVRQMTRIYDADPVIWQEPYFSVSGLGDERAIGAVSLMAPYSIGDIKDRSRNPAARIVCPGIQFRAHDTHQAALHIDPNEMFIVFDGPMNAVTGQPIFGG